MDAQAAAHAAEQRFMEFDLDKDPRCQRFIMQSGAKTPEELEMATREWYRADVDPNLPVEPPDHDVFRPGAMHRSARVVCAVLHIVALLATTLVVVPILRHKRAQVLYYRSLQIWIIAFVIELGSKWWLKGNRDWRVIVTDDSLFMLIMLVVFLPAPMIPLLGASPFIGSLYFLASLVIEEHTLFQKIPRPLFLQMRQVAWHLEMQRQAASHLRADMEVALAFLLVVITCANLRMFFITFIFCNFLRMRYILHPPTVATFQKVDAACARIASLSEPTDFIYGWVRKGLQGLVSPKSGKEKKTK
jgi:hypothetical protein